MQKFESTLHFSNSFAWIQGILLTGGLIGVIYAGLPWYVVIALIVGLLAYIFCNLFTNAQWQMIRQDANGWSLKKAGKTFLIEPLGDSTVTGWVSILRFKQPEKRFMQSCVIFRDSMPDDAYRAFIVRMRYFKKNREKHPEIR